MQICPRCQRANPPQAVFCYFDGIVLGQGAAGAAPPGQLPHEFVFPSGRRCKSVDDLVQGCQYEWEDARDLLRRGDFGRFFGHVGRHDLARTAQEHQALPDPDIALHEFVSQLPATQVQGPRLDLNPRRIMLGGVRTGEQRQLPLTVTNQGKGLLQGKITVSEGGQWLKIVGGTNPAECALKTARAQQVALHVDARGLTAPQTYSGKLTVITNGGVTEVPVRLDVASVPFTRPPFQGANSPRAMAERMRTNPKQAVPILESGEVARWFKANGWTYPVPGQTAHGVAAVQQFFECMGLSKPPPLQLSEQELQFICTPPEVVPARVTLRTPSKKWVYAQAEADVPWLRITTPEVSGPQQAQVAFEIDSTLMDPGLHQGFVHLSANAGQKLAVRVQVDCRRPHEPFTRRLLRPFFVGALLALFLRLLLAGPADLYARGWAQGPDSAAWPQVPWQHVPGAENAFLRPFVVCTWWVGVPLGAVLAWRRGGRLTDVFCGAVAGGGAGLIGAATLGCLLLVLDALPRGLLRGLTTPSALAGSRSFWMLLWVLLASASWAALGGGAGFLLSGLGRRGLRLLGAAAEPVAWLFRACGFERAAAFFVLQG